MESHHAPKPTFSRFPFNYSLLLLLLRPDLLRSFFATFLCSPFLDFRSPQNSFPFLAGTLKREHTTKPSRCLPKISFANPTFSAPPPPSRFCKLFVLQVKPKDQQ